MHPKIVCTYIKIYNIDYTAVNTSIIKNILIVLNAIATYIYYIY